MVALKMIILVLSLGMDTLMMSISLGMVNTKGKTKIALTFASCEALMALVGLLVGQGAGRLVGHWASLIGGIALIGLAVWLIFFEDDDDVDGRLGHSLAGWALLLTALSISVDELAVGFSMGLIGVPIALTIALIALQATLFTMIGLTFGSRLKPYLGEWAEKLAGIFLGLLGLWILLAAILSY